MSQTLTTLEPNATLDITALQARAVVDAAILKSTEIGVNMDIAVVDAGPRTARGSLCPLLVARAARRGCCGMAGLRHPPQRRPRLSAGPVGPKAIRKVVAGRKARPIAAPFKPGNASKSWQIRSRSWPT